MKQLEQMKEILVGAVQGQMTHLENVDTKELGEAIDMIKDLAEAIYYCTVTEAMEGKEPVGGHRETMYYPVMYYQDREDWRPEDPYKRRYYDGNGNSQGSTSGSTSTSSSGSGTRHYSERDLGEIMRDRREGRSPMMRKMYMESKEMHKDKATSMHELEKYVQELTSDLMEMIEDASVEEKQLLSNKISTLATKIK